MANRTTWRPAPGGVGGGEVAGTGFGGGFTIWYRRRRAAMRCRAIELLNTAVSSNRNLTAFRGGGGRNQLVRSCRMTI